MARGNKRPAASALEGDGAEKRGRLGANSADDSTRRTQNPSGFELLAARVDTLADELQVVKHELQTLPQRIATAVAKELCENFSISGVNVPVTLRDMDVRLDALRDKVVDELRKETASTAPRGDGVQELAGEQWWKSWAPPNDERIRRFVPPDWEFPARTTVRRAWDLWHFGDRTTGIRPYKLLSKQHDVDAKNHMQYHRFRAVMSELETIAMDNAFIPQSCKIHELPTAQVDELFGRCFALLLEKLYPSSASSKRAEELSCGTVYNRLCAYRKSTQAP